MCVQEENEQGKETIMRLEGSTQDLERNLDELKQKIANKDEEIRQQKNEIKEIEKVSIARSLECIFALNLIKVRKCRDVAPTNRFVSSLIVLRLMMCLLIMWP